MNSLIPGRAPRRSAAVTRLFLPGILLAPDLRQRAGEFRRPEFLLGQGRRPARQRLSVGDDGIQQRLRTDYVSHRGNGNSGNPDLDPVELQLSAGPHTIEIFAREGGTRLDRIGLELKQDADMRILSRNKPALASSSASGSLDPAKAVDGNAVTRWASLSGDDQWIRLDLQARDRIDRVMLFWDGAYGKEYQIQISEDGSAWTTLYHKTDGTGGSDNLMLDGTGRYVRMKGIKRGTSGAYSLKEFDVYGAAVPINFVCQGGCLSAQPLSRYQNAVLNTTGERWYVVTETVAGWQASEIAGRTISVNGVTLQP